jgi:hypothetical protein
MKNRVKKQNKKGETMGIRKFISLLLLVAFTLQLAPANAASFDNAGTTLPTIVQDTGSKANGANRDVVPVTIRVNNILSGELVFSRVSDAGTGAAAVSIANNGQIAVSGGSITTRRAFVLTPPSGTQFVGLPTDGYVRALSRSLTNGLDAGTPSTLNISLGSGTTDSVLPGGSGNANGNMFLAGVLTENGTATYFGSAIQKGSIVVYPVTFVPDGGSNTSDISFSLTGFGLAADPSLDATSFSGTLSAAYLAPTGTPLAALTSVSTGTFSVASATAAPAAGKLETTALLNEPDNQPNVVLASRLASGSSTIKIGPGLITSTGTGLTTLNVDTDAIIIRARERAESTTSSKAYYQTPFATSAFVPGQALTANGATSIAILNTALTDTTKFPNTANARITVTFKAVNPTTGADSDATLVVNAVGVSLFGQRALDRVRDITNNRTATLANGGWLGALALGTNGSASKANFGLGVIYNGTSATSALVVRDATPANYSVQTANVGILAASNTSVPRPDANAPTSIANGTTAVGIYPGSLVTDINNGNNASAWDIVATANGSGTTPFSFSLNGGAAFNGAVNNGYPIYTPGEVTARLVSGAANAWFTILGTETGVAIDDGRDLTVGATNLSTILPSKAPVLNADGTTYNAANNAVIVANLTDKVLTILPLTNRYDSLRDALAVRPEMTLTLGTNSRTQGVKIVAVISGGNIGTSEEVVVAEVLAAGSLTSTYTLQTLPVAGDMSSLMVENTTVAGNGRALISLSSVTGASATTDALSDFYPTGTTLDNTVPPLFCGGTAGSGKKGPNGVVFQPKARMVTITEAAANQFKSVDDLNTARIRVTLPTGWDLNAYNGSLDASQILGLVYTSNGATGTFTSAPRLARIQPRNVNTGSTGTDAAFIDIDVGTPGTTTQSVNRVIGLVFKPNALIAPVGTTDFNATITVVDVGTTNTRGATLADDTVLSTIGTVSLADSCSNFLSLSYCDDALSSYQTTGSLTNGMTDAKAVTNGSSLTTFSSAPTKTIRLIANTTSSVALPDLCIEEGIADALPIGQGVDGIPNAFGEASVTTNGTGVLHIASSFQGSADIGLAVGSSPLVLVSDNSVTSSAPSGTANDVSFTVSESSVTGRKRPFTQKTQFRVRGLQVDDATAGTVPPAQSFIAWFEAVTGAGNYAVGSSIPLSVRKDTVNGNSLVGITSASAEDVKMAANYLNGDILDNSNSTGAVTDISFSDTSTANNNDLSIVFSSSTTAPVLSNAVTTQVDDNTYSVLNSSTNISVSVSAITGSTDKLVEVSGAAGSLEPGSTLTISTSGTGPSDSVFVPVLANGSFKGVIRASTSQTITVVQTPDSADTSVAPQIRTLDVADQNVDPAITAAVAQDIGLGTVSEKGKVPVVFQVTSTGKSGGLDFVPTASQLTLGGAPVTAVTGSTNKFIGLVDFAKSNALTVVCTVGSKVSTATLTELDSEAATKLGAPTLTGVRNNTAGFIVLKGQRLRNGQTFGFVLNDGTFQAVTLRNQTQNEAKTLSRRSAAAETIPANAAYAVFSVPDRGVASRAITTP